MEASGGGDMPVSVGAGERRMKMKVMVAVDESDCSFHALKWALDNVLNNMTTTATPDENIEDGGGMVFLVHVEPAFHPAVYPIGTSALYPASASLEDLMRKAQREKSTSTLSRALQMCRDNQIKAESIILTGDAREMICQAADQMHVDLLIMGSRGLSVLKRAFLGSVSDYCAHHAKTPILIVKPPEDKEHKKK
uniref:UspA domain-containing protein n=1 Tax=Lotus japonicus TaxID=34305 RepID=I3SSF4_LOTJA|nr:unknown [Lotus japonicus]